MNKDIIKIDNDEYKLLVVLDNQYIIYTNLDNLNPNDNIMVIKVKSMDELNNIIPMTDEELKNVEEKYLSIINE